MRQTLSVSKILNYLDVSPKFLKILEKSIMANIMVTCFQKATPMPDLYL